MKTQVINLFKAPVFPGDTQKTRIAHLLNTIVITCFFSGIFGLVIGVPFLFGGKPTSFALILYTVMVTSFCWVLLRKGAINTASIVIVMSLQLLAIGNTYAGGGIASKDLIVFTLPVVVSQLLLGYRGALISFIFAFFTLSVFAYLGFSGIDIPKLMPGVPLGVWFSSALVMWVLYLTVELSVKGWDQSIAKVKHELEERRRTEAERDRYKEQLFQASKMESLGRMAGSVAHDFNNLLTVIDLNVQLLKHLKPGDERYLGELEHIGGALTSAKGMTRSLLDFSKKRDLRPEKLELDILIKKDQALLEKLLGDKASLFVELGAQGLAIMADKTGLEQMIQNLVVNAREAMGSDGVLSITTEELENREDLPNMKAGWYLLLRVKDNGRGMSAETKEKIFEPFFTTKDSGTGLGLATVFGVVKQHGGSIEVDSEPGIGTTFNIAFPRA